MLVRSWNLFHGNAKPPERRSFLERMVRLVTADMPDVVCLQEVPAWALPRLAEWSGMSAVGAIAARPRIGPLPSTPEIGRRLTAPYPDVFRSLFAGQANAILVRPERRARDRRTIVLNARSFRLAQARWLGLGLVARLAWARERRVCHAVRVGARAGGSAIVANLHATNYGADKRLADAELLRAAAFADGLALPNEAVLLAGDFNVSTAESRTLRELVAPEWGFSRPGSGIDHVLVRGLEIVRGPERWPLERRVLDGRVLSDHAPVEVELA